MGLRALSLCHRQGLEPNISALIKPVLPSSTGPSPHFPRGGYVCVYICAKLSHMSTTQCQLLGFAQAWPRRHFRSFDASNCNARLVDCVGRRVAFGGSPPGHGVGLSGRHVCASPTGSCGSWQKARSLLLSLSLFLNRQFSSPPLIDRSPVCQLLTEQ